MTVAVPSGRLTPPDVLRLEDEGLFELVDGKLVEKQMSFLANFTAAQITTALSNHSPRGRFGFVLPEQSFQCFPHDRERVRRPDVAFILGSRIAALADKGHLEIAPDIAVEVVSPTDRIYDLDEKLVDYRLAGVSLVWVVNPQSHTIRIHRLDQTVTELSESDMLQGESVLPGFKVLVAELFPPLPARAAGSRRDDR